MAERDPWDVSEVLSEESPAPETVAYADDEWGVAEVVEQQPTERPGILDVAMSDEVLSAAAPNVGRFKKWMTEGADTWLDPLASMGKAWGKGSGAAAQMAGAKLEQSGRAVLHEQPITEADIDAEKRASAEHRVGLSRGVGGRGFRPKGAIERPVVTEEEIQDSLEHGSPAQWYAERQARNKMQEQQDYLRATGNINDPLEREAAADKIVAGKFIQEVGESAVTSDLYADPYHDKTPIDKRLVERPVETILVEGAKQAPNFIFSMGGAIVGGRMGVSPYVTAGGTSFVLESGDIYQEGKEFLTKKYGDEEKIPDLEWNKLSQLANEHGAFNATLDAITPGNQIARALVGKTMVRRILSKAGAKYVTKELIKDLSRELPTELLQEESTMQALERAGRGFSPDEKMERRLTVMAGIVLPTGAGSVISSADAIHRTDAELLSGYTRPPYQQAGIKRTAKPTSSETPQEPAVNDPWGVSEVAPGERIEPTMDEQAPAPQIPTVSQTTDLPIAPQTETAITPETQAATTLSASAEVMPTIPISTQAVPGIPTAAIQREKPGAVRPTKSAFVDLIASSGGLSREEAEAQGIDPAYLKDFKGKQPLFPKTGGMTFDEAAELISQHGYGSEDYSANELLNLLDRSLRGETVMPARAVTTEKDLATAAGLQGYLDAQEAAQAQELVRQARSLKPVTESDLGAATAEMPDYSDEDLIAGQVFEESEYDPAMSGEARALFELHQDAKQYDEATADGILEAQKPPSEIARGLYQIIQEGKKRGRPADEPRAPEGAKEQGPAAQAPAVEPRAVEQPAAEEGFRLEPQQVTDRGNIQNKELPRKGSSAQGTTRATTADSGRNRPDAAVVAADDKAGTKGNKTSELADDLFGAAPSPTQQAINRARGEREPTGPYVPPSAGPGELFAGPRPEQLDITERRHDTEQRKRVAEMSHDEMIRALLLDDLTGLPNRRAYEESQKKAVQVFMDMDSLKYMNDTFGHDAGDKILKTFGEVLRTAAGNDAYHLSGDEFIIQADTVEAADTIMQAANETAEAVTLEFQAPDGKRINLTGLGFSYGYGEPYDGQEGPAYRLAEIQAANNKTERENLGLRAKRGEPPAQVSEKPAVRDQALARAPAEETETADRPAEVDEAATSPQNDLPQPKDKQKKSPYNESPDKRSDNAGDTKYTRQQAAYRRTEAGGNTKRGRQKATKADVLLNEDTLPQSEGQGVQGLRGKGNNDLPSVAGELRELHGGRLAETEPSTQSGAEEQQRTVQPEELRVGAEGSAEQQYAGDQVDNVQRRAADDDAVGESARPRDRDAAGAARQVHARKGAKPRKAASDERKDGGVERGGSPTGETGARDGNADQDGAFAAVGRDGVGTGTPTGNQAQEREISDTQRRDQDAGRVVEGNRNSKNNAGAAAKARLAGGESIEPVKETEKTPRSHGIPKEATTVHSFVNNNPLKTHPDYKASKSGDYEAAARLVRDLVKPENLEAARKFGADAIFVPAVGMEASGINQIPVLLAERYAAETGAKTSIGEIVQTNKAYHTGAGAMERLIVRPRFDGPVEQGGKYVLVDDVTTMGGTLAEMANHIQANGGEVVGVVTLVNASRSATMIPSKHQIREIERRYGHEISTIFGIEPAGLTRDEATYILGFRDADSLRNRATAAEKQRSERLRAKGIQEKDVGSPSAEEPKFARVLPQTETPEFKRWFGDSKVVDENGKPMVVYHGTNSDFSEFDTSGSELGAHFGTAAQADGFTSDKGGRVIPVYIRLVNPLRLEDHGEFNISLVSKQLREKGILSSAAYSKIEEYLYYPSAELEIDAIATLRDSIKRAGHDGIVYLNRREGTHDPFGDNGVDGDSLNEMSDDEVLDMFPDVDDSYIVFDPAQIKSATGNRGTFDPNSPDIRFAGTQTPTAGLEALAIEEHIAPILKRLKTKVPVTVVESYEDLPPAVYDRIKEEGVDVQGVAYDGNVYLVASQIPTLDTAERVLLDHELRHIGLRELLGRDLGPVLTKAFYGKEHAKIMQFARERGLRTASRTDSMTAAEEYIVNLAETRQENTLLQKVYAAIRDFLRRLGFKIELADIDLRDIVSRAGSLIERGNRSVPKGAVTLSQTTEPATEQPVFSTPAPIFYSQMQRALADKLPASGPAPVLRAQIRNLAKKGEFKQEEYDWSGIDQWLSDQNGKITKEQILDFLRANEIQVVDSIHRDTASSPDASLLLQKLEEYKIKLSQYGYFDSDPGNNLTPGLFDVFRLNSELSNGMDYVDFGYADSDEISEHFTKHKDELVKIMGRQGYDDLKDANDIMRAYDRSERAMPIQGGTIFEKYTLPGGKNYRELLLTLPTEKRPIPSSEMDLSRPDAEQQLEAQQQSNAGLFRSSHFNEPNILAHVRFDDRTDADGKRVLFIEEVQSDWHQKGRKEGYIGSATVEVRPSENGWGIFAGNKRIGYFNEEDDAIKASKLPSYKEQAEQEQRAAVPDAPFKTTWPMLVMRRMIRWGAENGYDRIAWTTGEQQAARYDLSKQVDRVELRKGVDGNYQVRAFTKGDSNPAINEGDVPLSRVEELVGKELAKKAEAQRAGFVEKYSGEALKVGGEGMKSFYDQMLPSMVGKYVKKWGGKVGETTLETPGGIGKWRYDGPPVTWPEVSKEAHNGNLSATLGLQAQEIYRAMRDDGLSFPAAVEKYGSYATAEHFGGKLIDVAQKNPVHSLDITPAMRDSVMQGQPMFARRPSGVTGPVTFSDPRTEARYRASRMGMNDPRRLPQRMKEWFAHVGAGFTRHYIDMPNIPEYAKAHEMLRQYEAAPQAAKEKAVGILKETTKDMTPAEFDLFTRKVILDDLAFEDSQQHQLPFGFTSKTLANDKSAVDQAVKASPKVEKAVFVRKRFLDRVTDQLVDKGILSADQIKNPAYFRHQVLTYARLWQYTQGSSKLKKPKPGYAKRRHGSEEDINANYLEAEFEFLHRALIDVKAADTIEGIQDEYDIKEMLKQKAAVQNKGKPDDQKITWRDIIPDDYTTWQPDKGNVFFLGQSIGEKAINHILETLATNSPQVSTAELTEVLDGIRSALMVGGKKREMVIPHELAATLDEMRPNVERGFMDHLFSVPLGAWKQWVLINPRRVLRYNLNNLSGDLDAIIAGSPKAMRKLPQAIRELYLIQRGKAVPSARYREAIARGVFDSGLTIQEIPDINFLKKFDNLIGGPKVTEIPGYIAMRVWRALKEYTQFRENWMRYAAYLDYVERLEKGESMESIGYGATNPDIVDQIKDNKDRAALLARDMVGDYGNISAFGQEIRRKLIPFYSWIEINTGRYLRLIANAYGQGLGKGLGTTATIGAIKGARITAWLYVRMAILYLLVQMFNNLMFPDDEEALSPTDRTRLHLLMGKDKDGKIRMLRFQGALSDFLAWFGFDEAVGTIGNIEKGRASWFDVVQVVAKAPVNKVVGGITPLIKTPVELASGKSFYPDVFNPRRVYDKPREMFRLFSLDPEYDWLTGNPMRGYAEQAEGLLFYKRDVGEIAFYQIYELQRQYMRGKGVEGGTDFSTPKSRAIRKLRLAKRYEDKEAAAKAMDELREIGVRPYEVTAAIRRMRPLSGLSVRDRNAFMQTLDAKEMQLLNEANEYYRRVYEGG